MIATSSEHLEPLLRGERDGVRDVVEREVSLLERGERAASNSSMKQRAACGTVRQRSRAPKSRKLPIVHAARSRSRASAGSSTLSSSTGSSESSAHLRPRRVGVATRGDRGQPAPCVVDPA